jgi:AcrR family transcriptional regulator
MSQPTQARLPAAERRAAIVAAALEVFGNGSYARSTTAEIARVAGVSEPIIYRHFPSKKELWFASLDEAWHQLRTRIEHKMMVPLTDEEPGAASPVPRGPWADPLLPHLWVQGVTEAGDDEEMQAYLRTHVREVHDFVAAGMRAGQAAGTVPADRDADAEAWIFLAGGLLRSFADRLGGLLGAGEFAAIVRERRRWLSES